MQRRVPPWLIASFLAGAGFAACGGDPEVNRDDDGFAGSAGGGAGGAAASGGLFGDSRVCTAGEYACDGNQARECDGDGGFVGEPIDCEAEGKKCTNLLGCVTCFPGEQKCEGDTGMVCNELGTGFDEFDCDPVQGMTCEADGCKGSCSPPELFPSYLGCEYYPTMTLTGVWEGFEFAVAVANAGTETANVLVDRAGSNVTTTTVAAGSVGIIKLPWVSELKGGDADACQVPPDPGATRLVDGGAYRLRSDQPVAVYQLSPLDYEISPPPTACPIGSKCPGAPPGGTNDLCLSYSNDASLLLPVTRLTASYTTVTWPSTQGRAAFITVTATVDGTDVEVLGDGLFAAGGGIDANGKGTVTMDRGDVLQVLARHDGAPDAYGADPSGTRIQATKPVQVIAGNSCANVPEPRTFACDHVEHAMIPAETLGTDYLVTFPAALASESPHVIRIVPLEAGTSIEFDPPSVSAGATISPGDPPFELAGVMEDFRVSADKPILVAQYMQGQDSVPSGSGDPSMSVAVPSEQFRDSYRFAASTTYDTNFVNVIAPTGATVTLDGDAIPASEFQAIGASGFSVARHELSRSDQFHEISSPQQFGIVVYGYGRFTSFMYPGGLDLKRLQPPPIF